MTSSVCEEHTASTLRPSPTSPIVCVNRIMRAVLYTHGCVWPGYLQRPVTDLHFSFSVGFFRSLSVQYEVTF